MFFFSVLVFRERFLSITHVRIFLWLCNLLLILTVKTSNFHLCPSSIPLSLIMSPLLLITQSEPILKQLISV